MRKLSNLHKNRKKIKTLRYKRIKIIVGTPFVTSFTIYKRETFGENQSEELEKLNNLYLDYMNGNLSEHQNIKDNE